MSYEARYYDRYAHYMEMDLADVPLFRYISDACQRLEKGTMLDVGCGLGYLLDWISRQGWSGVGVDFSAASLAAGHGLYQGLQFVRASAYDLPFADNRFDAVLAVNVIEHLERPRDLVEQVFRVLKPQGTLILVTPEVRSLFKRLWIHDSTHFHEFTKDELVSLLSEFGTVADARVTNSVGRLGRRLNYLFARVFPCDILVEARKPDVS